MVPLENLWESTFEKETLMQTHSRFREICVDAVARGTVVAVVLLYAYNTFPSMPSPPMTYVMCYMRFHM